MLGEDIDKIVKDVMVNVFNEGLYECSGLLRNLIMFNNLYILGSESLYLTLMESGNKIKLEVERTNEEYDVIVTDNFVEEFTTLLEGTIKPKLERLHQEEFQLYNVLESKGYLDDDVLNYINYGWVSGKVRISISNNVPFVRDILEDTGLNTRTFGYTDVEGIVTHIGRLLGMLRELGKEFNDYGRLNDSINLVLQGISDDIKDSALKKYWG